LSPLASRSKELPAKSLKPEKIENWSQKVALADRALLIVAGIALVSGLVRFVVARHLELFQDEALYWYIGVHAPLTFSPHPPGTPLLARLGAAVLGRTEIAIRLGSVVLGSLVLFPFYFLGRRILGTSAALWATVAFALTPMYFGFGTICTPDMPQLFIWCTLLYAAWRALEEDSDSWWIATWLILGIGLYFKYILILFVPALVLYLSWVGLLRRAMNSRGFWIGIALCILVFFPLAIWREASTGWQAIQYHLEDRQKWTPDNLKSIVIYFGIHLGYYSPLLYLGMIWGLVWCARRARKTHDWRSAFLASFGLAPWIFFLVIAFFTKRELSREQWDAPAYVCGLLAASHWAHTWLQDKSLRVPLLWRKGLVVGAFGLSGLTVIGAILEAMTGLPSRITGHQPLFSTMIGWRTMARRVDALVAAQEPNRPLVFLGNSFVPALQYAFYGQQQIPVFTLNHSANKKFGLQRLLGELQVDHQALLQRKGTDAIFVAEGELTDDANRKLDSLRKRLLRFFENVEPLPPVDIAGNAKQKRFYVLVCQRLYLKKEDAELSPPQP
jgi:4-amino-4-deoxy-L-arabinose transferase-like glycosyltransferase